MELNDIVCSEDANNVENLRFLTNAGEIKCRFHKASTGNAAILWVFGSGGGLGGPAGGVYERLAAEFQQRSTSSLQLDYRRPGFLRDCVLDVLLGIEYLTKLNIDRIVLVGHSFGGAVVITTGIISDRVIAVAAMSSQVSGAESVASLSPKPLLLIHGTDDEILPDSCSRYLYQEARGPKELILYENCRHGLDQCRDELDRDLKRWLTEVLE